MSLLMKVKSTTLGILSKINIKNLDRGMAQFDKCMSVFNKALNDFGSAMDSMTKELDSDIEKSRSKENFEGKKNKENLKKLLGNSTKSQILLWSEKKSSKLSKDQIPI